MKTTVSQQKEWIERTLKGAIPSSDCLEKDLYRSMEYSLLAGGKRIRPILLLEFYKACGGDPQDVLLFAAAVEMIHTYSLIHDDLPCMDNDHTRRGLPSNHIVFGEDIALLAGDALLNLAFETMLSEQSIEKVGAEKAIKAAHILARESGSTGMIAGQVIDLTHEGKNISLSVLKEMDHKKTGALIKAACLMGCVLADADEKELKAADFFAEALGLSFQIVDDILDVTADPSELGKPIGSDESNQKSTYVSIFGIEKSKELVEKLTKEAIQALGQFSGDTSNLKELSLSLQTRRN